MSHSFSESKDTCSKCGCTWQAIEAFKWKCVEESSASEDSQDARHFLKQGGQAAAKKNQTGLWADLKTYAGEVYNQGDVKAGMKLVGEIVGAISLLLLAGKVMYFLTGGRSNYLIQKALADLANGYIKLNADDRKSVRAFVLAAKTGFGVFR